MGRKALNKTPATDAVELDQNKIGNAMVAMRQDAQEDLAELCDLAGDVKAIQMAGMIRKFSAAAEIRLFQSVRESRKIKDLPLRAPDGGLRRAENIEQFCTLAFGRSYSKMAEEAQNFDLLGEESYELANRLGLNRNALRAARALPPEQLEVVRTAIADGSSKAEVLSVIEDLAVKVEEATAATEEVRAELEAERELSTKKTQKIDKLTRANRLIAKLPPDETLAALRKEASAVATDAEATVLGGLRQALVTLHNHDQEHETEGNVVFMAGLVGQVQAVLTALRQEFNLPDVSNAADQKLAADMAQWDK